MRTDVPLIEQAWDYYFARKNPEELRYIRIAIAEEAVHHFAYKPEKINAANMTRYQEFTPNDLLQFVKPRLEDANEGNEAICKAIGADPSEYRGKLRDLAPLVALVAEDCIRARQELEAFKNAMRDIFGYGA